MIDLYYIIIPPEVLGPQQLQRIRERHPSDTQGFRKIPLEAPNWMGRQWAMLDGATVRLKVCPAKVLGRWNTWGSSDLRRVVLDTAPLVLRELGVRVTAEVLAHLAAGNYRLHEVHIAHQFWLRNRGITDFVQSVARTIGESHRPQLFPPGRGHGFYLDPWSRTRSWVCYNKQHETEQKAVPRYRQRFVAAQGFVRAGIGLDREFQRLVASCGPRLELRLGDHFFRRNPALATGSDWSADTADRLYRQYLTKLRLPSRVSAVYCRERAQRLPREVLKSYLLWAHGEDLRALFRSDQTFQVHRRAVLGELGVDVSLPASAVLARRGTVDAARVFTWSNRVRVQDLQCFWE
jgi:hypothetical protein